MTPEDIKIVQESWRKVDPVKEIAAELFYTRLFELDPLLRAFCGDDVKSRQTRFTLILRAFRRTSKHSALTHSKAAAPRRRAKKKPSRT